MTVTSNDSIIKEVLHIRSFVMTSF